MAPPAPPRFSTITGCPSCLASAVLTTRAITSDEPPAGYGTIRLTGLDGKTSAAWAPNAMRRPATQAVRVFLRFIAVLRDGGSHLPALRKRRRRRMVRTAAYQ